MEYREDAEGACLQSAHEEPCLRLLVIALLLASFKAVGLMHQISLFVAGWYSSSPTLAIDLGVYLHKPTSSCRSTERETFSFFSLLYLTSRESDTGWSITRLSKKPVLEYLLYTLMLIQKQG